jgi:hypothetical protein
MEAEVNCRTTHYVPELDGTPLLNVSAIPLPASSNLLIKLAGKLGRI